MSADTRALFAAGARWVVVAVAAYVVAHAELAWLTADEGALVASSAAIAIARVFAVSRRSFDASWPRAIAHDALVGAATVAIAWCFGRSDDFVGDAGPTIARIALTEGAMSVVWLAAWRERNARGVATWALVLMVAGLWRLERASIVAVGSVILALASAYPVSGRDDARSRPWWSLIGVAVAMASLSRAWVGAYPSWIDARFADAFAVECPELKEGGLCPTARERRFATFAIDARRGPGRSGETPIGKSVGVLVGIDVRAPLRRPIRGADLFCKLGGHQFSPSLMGEIALMTVVEQPISIEPSGTHVGHHVHIHDDHWNGHTFAMTLVDENDTRARTFVFDHDACSMTVTPAPMPKL